MEEEHAGSGVEKAAYVQFVKFEKKVLELLESHEYDPDEHERLMQAFRVLDPDHTGFIEAHKMKEALTKKSARGEEPELKDKEVEEFLRRAKDMETGNVYYEDYIALLRTEAETSSI